jgi:uncharacterized protein YbjT (DUF2867 family)
MKTALVVGATGLVGRYLVDELLEHGTFDRVVLWVRKPIDLQHPILHQQVVDFDSIEQMDIRVHSVYCCLGTTIRKAGCKDAVCKVDLEYPLQVAQLALRAGATAYGIVTSMGADPLSRFFYNRVKGEVEKELSGLGYNRLLILRPSMLLGDREDARWGEAIGKLLMQLLSFLIPLNYKAVHGMKVARAMRIKMEDSDLGTEVLSSGSIQAY